MHNTFESKELQKRSTVAFFATVQHEGGHPVERKIEYFNLDAIISVGYRVNSKQGTQFRIWASNVLKRHLIDGYTLNEKRLKQQTEKFQALQRAIKLIGSTKDRKQLEYKEALGLLEVIKDYNYALSLLDDYGHRRPKISQTTKKEKFILGNNGQI